MRIGITDPMGTDDKFDGYAAWIRLHAPGAEVVRLSYRLANADLASGCDRILLTGGGDGTFTVVVTAVVKEARRRDVPLPRFGLLRLGTGNSLAWVLGASKAGRRGLAVDLQRLRSEAGSRWLRLVEAEGMLSPFCGFGIDAVMLRDYNQVKTLLARGPLKRFAPGPVAYAVAATTRTIPSYVFRPTLRIGGSTAPPGS